MSLLKVENLYVGYGKKHIVKDVFLKIEEGKTIGILGSNGCGKSTLMKALCKGLSYSGNVWIQDKELRRLSEKALAKSCSYVPQQSGLSIDICVRDVVLMGFHPYLNVLEGPTEEMKKETEALLCQIGLKEYIFSNYMELSEGQKRLCILARSLIARTKLLFMDEPDAALDFEMRNMIMQIVERRVNEDGCGVLCTLHDTNLALAYCDYIYLMKDGKFVGGIAPFEDTKEEIEQKLKLIYGNIKLLTYSRENGDKRLAMVQA